MPGTTRASTRAGSHDGAPFAVAIPATSSRTLSQGYNRSARKIGRRHGTPAMAANTIARTSASPHRAPHNARCKTYSSASRPNSSTFGSWCRRLCIRSGCTVRARRHTRSRTDRSRRPNAAPRTSNSAVEPRNHPRPLRCGRHRRLHRRTRYRAPRGSPARFALDAAMPVSGPASPAPAPVSAPASPSCFLSLPIINDSVSRRIARTSGSRRMRFVDPVVVAAVDGADRSRPTSCGPPPPGFSSWALAASESASRNVDVSAAIYASLERAVRVVVRTTVALGAGKGLGSANHSSERLRRWTGSPKIGEDDASPPAVSSRPATCSPHTRVVTRSSRQLLNSARSLTTLHFGRAGGGRSMREYLRVADEAALQRPADQLQ